MFNQRRILAVLAAVTLVVVIGAGTAAAANVPMYRPGITVQNYAVPRANYMDPFGFNRMNAYRLDVWGQAMRNVPPYALGYNPYVPPVYYNSSPMGPYMPLPAVPPLPPPPAMVNPYFNPYGGY
jgi:hypothetical protein